MGVFLAYVSARGHALVDGQLYVPETWVDDRARCRAAGVPDTVEFATKAEIGLAVLQAARARGHLQGDWVTADAGYGEVPSLRDALNADGWRYVLELPLDTRVFTQPAAVAADRTRRCLAWYPERRPRRRCAPWPPRWTGPPGRI